MKFIPGQTYRANIGGRVYKIHIMYRLKSIYRGKWLIVYRYYGKHKQWWHEAIEMERTLSVLVDIAKEGEG